MGTKQKFYALVKVIVVNDSIYDTAYQSVSLAKSQEQANDMILDKIEKTLSYGLNVVDKEEIEAKVRELLAACKLDKKNMYDLLEYWEEVTAEGFIIEQVEV